MSRQSMSQLVADSYLLIPLAMCCPPLAPKGVITARDAPVMPGPPIVQMYMEHHSISELPGKAHWADEILDPVLASQILNLE